MKYAVCLTVATLILWLQALPATAAPIIAVLQEEAKRNTDDVLQTGVRLTFREERGNWIPVCSETNAREWRLGCAFAADMAAKWRIVLHGHAIGDVKTQGWADTGNYGEIGLLKIAGPEAPHAGSRDTLFGGWTDEPVHHPLVASNALLSWRMRWRQAYPADTPTAPFLAQLRKQVHAIPDCSKDGEYGPEKPLKLSDIHVTELWKTVRGERLIAASIRPERVKLCDNQSGLLDDVWFFDDAKSGLRALPALATNGATHRVIDIGDFAGDGREEALFWLSGYDEDGFVLLYDGFKKSTRFTWHYH